MGQNAEGKAGGLLALDSPVRNKFQTDYAWRQLKWHTVIFGQLHTFGCRGIRLADAYVRTALCACGLASLRSPCQKACRQKQCACVQATVEVISYKNTVAQHV